MRRYFVLAGHNYYPAGWDDWVGDYNTLEDAVAAGIEGAARYKSYGWFSIFDSMTSSVVETDR